MTTPARADFTSDRHDIVHVAADARPDFLNRVQFFAFWRTDQEWVPGGVRGQVFHTDLDAWVKRNEERGRTVTVIRVPS